MRRWAGRAFSLVRAGAAVLATAASLAGPGLSTARAATVVSVTPQGDVPQARELVITFDRAVVPVGDAAQPAPAGVSCQGDTPRGEGRWQDERRWVYRWTTPLGPGVRCSIELKAGWTAALPEAGALTGRRTWSFATGGPAVVRVQPWEGATIEEDQHFLLELNGPVDEASVLRHAWCEVDGLGDRLALKLVAGAARDAVLKSRRLERKSARTLLATCERALPPGAAVRLVWGAGIASAGRPGLVTRDRQVFGYDVREAFTAEFSCEREQAQAPCLPVRPMTLGFSAPVARAQAALVRLKPLAPATGAPLAPVFEPDERDPEVSFLRFPVPLAAQARYAVELPAGLKDTGGRPLANAGSFPLTVATGDAPPIAKFASAPFGVIERKADPVLPLTLRHVQPDLRPAAAGGQVRVKTLTRPADIHAWYATLRRYHEGTLTAREAGLPQARWYTLEDDTDARGRKVKRRVERQVEARTLSLLQREADAQRLVLPQLDGGDPRPFEVIGLPLGRPGYHVVEVESQRLGARLLDPAGPMFVRTGALVTNLGVHVKLGRANTLVWVTTLDRAAPVPGADVTVHDCRGSMLARGRTDALGLARFDQAFDPGRPHRPAGAPADQALPCTVDEGLFVSAETAAAGNEPADIGFAFSGWQQGIEPWRYNVPVSWDRATAVRAHTVFDRTLLRAGETVSMKHYARSETLQGLALLPAGALPTRAKVEHVGSGQEASVPLQWAGPRSATSSWAIPAAAKPGLYRVSLERDADPTRADDPATSWPAGTFRVEAFRVPLVEATLAAPKAVPPAPTSLALDVSLQHLSGGGLAEAPIRTTALLRAQAPRFAGRDDWRFDPPREAGADDARADLGEDEDDAGAGAPGGTVVADRLPGRTDRQGGARVELKGLPPLKGPSMLQAEVSFEDPNGETQTVATQVPLWPAGVVVGLKADGWAGGQGPVRWAVLVLDTEGRPVAKQAVEVRGRLAVPTATRQRLVGGFYAYDQRTTHEDLGLLCQGSTDARGELACEATLDKAGEVELVASARDSAGRPAQAATSVWVTRRGDLWFTQDRDDRLEVLPEKKRLEPGETARLQVRMPYRAATALVTVEREGVIASRVVTLRGDDPTIELKIDPAWAPNVYVGVLVLRGRVRDVPWHSFFRWGWREPLAWWRAWRDEGPVYTPPTAMVDLAKPSFRFGVAALEVGRAAHVLDVAVSTERTQYKVRETVQATVKVTQGGRPAPAGTEVAFAAVDEGLLALMPNRSWDLLAGLLQPRPWGVETATAQGEIVGRRHHGRKAVPAGGGGGGGATRELFDTLLLWQARVPVGPDGTARVTVPLNDSLTSFRLVAVADDGGQRFGHGSASVRVTQELQWLSALPAFVRDGDRLQAAATLRNATARELKVRATLAGTATLADGRTQALNLAPQDVVLPAAASRRVAWDVDIPGGATAIAWDGQVQETPAAGGGALQDRVKLVQPVRPAVPLRVVQATLQRFDGEGAGVSPPGRPKGEPGALQREGTPVTPPGRPKGETGAPQREGIPVTPPAGALADGGVPRGGLTLALAPRLGSGLPGLKRWFEAYPYRCLEQQASRAVGLRDRAAWDRLMTELPTYLDDDGLAGYFPPRAGEAATGSERLTAYLLTLAQEAGWPLPATQQQAMLDGLAAWTAGRIERRGWAPRADADVRRLAAIATLARHERAQARLLGTLEWAPDTWPTAALLDALAIVRRVPGVPDAEARRARLQQLLRARLVTSGTALRFTTEDDDRWSWLMDSPDANAVRLLLAVLDDPAWRDDVPRLVVGTLGRQRDGAWSTTVANAWGALALERYGATWEREPVSGSSRVTLGAFTRTQDWSRQPEGTTLTLPWPAGAGPTPLQMQHDGSGRPWVALQALAALAPTQPVRAGYAITRSVTAVERRDPQRWSRGDVLRVRLEVDAASDQAWVVIADPVPAGATVLGTGLGRDSALAARDDQRAGFRPAWEERGPDAYRAYVPHLPGGRHVVEYTLRLNAAGRYGLPPTRVEAMYAPDLHGELPNAPLEVSP